MFAVKTLKEQGEHTSLAGRVVIGIVIVQELFAVAFLTASEGTLPSVWALALLAGLVVLRPLAGWLLGFTLAVVVGGGGFALVGDSTATVAGYRRSSRPADR